MVIIETGSREGHSGEVWEDGSSVRAEQGRGFCRCIVERRTMDGS